VKEKGFLLIETVIAIAVFAIVAIGFMQGIQVGILGTYRVDVSNMALNLARSQMEYVKAQSYILYDYDCTPREGQPYLTIEEIPTGFNANFAVCNVPDMDANIVQHVTVTVTYQSESNVVELEGYKINPDVLPPLRDLPFVHTVDITVPNLPGADEDCPIRLSRGEFFAFYGYPYTFNITRAGVVAVTWVVDEKETYSLPPENINRIDVYLYRHGEGGKDDGPFDDEFYDNRWDTTCHECSVPSDCYDNCKKAENWEDPDPNYPRIVLMDDPDCWKQEEPVLCHDEELPGWAPPGEEPGWIAHDEIVYIKDEANVLTTVLNREEGTLSGTVTFTPGSTSITGSGTSFSIELEADYLIKKSDGAEWYVVASIESDTDLTLATPSSDDGDDAADATLYRVEIVPAGWYTIFFYNSNPIDHLDYLFTVATEWASVSYYSVVE